MDLIEGITDYKSVSSFVLPLLFDSVSLKFLFCVMNILCAVIELLKD